MFETKRGISPLVATVLLIAFSVALGAVVMSWGETYIEKKAEFVQSYPKAGTCDAATLSIIKVKGEWELCLRDNKVELFLDNGGVQLDGIKARIVGADGVAIIQNILTTPLPAGESLKTSFEHKPIGEIKQIKLTPQILFNGEAQFCTQSETTIEDIKQCA